MIALLIVVVVLGYLLERRAEREGLSILEVELSFSRSLVEPDEAFDLVATLRNRSRAFLPFLKLRIHLPAGLEAEVPQEDLYFDFHQDAHVQTATWMFPRQQLEIRIPLHAEKRGRYLIQGLSVARGDFLGLSEQKRDYPCFLELVVIPKLTEEQNVEQILGGYLGDLSVNRYLYEDPVLTVGYRDYTGREPLKMLSWTQIARTGKLMVKQYDYTVENSLCVVLNLAFGRIFSEETAEECYSLARTVCAQLEEKGIQYSFYSNVTVTGDFSSLSAVAEGLGRHHYLRIAEGLGRGLYHASSSCETLLERVMRGTEGSRGILFITPENDADVLAKARHFADGAGVNLYPIIGEEAAAC